MSSRPIVVAALCALVVAASACHSTESADLTATELADILDIRVWRVPQAPKGREWVIEVVSADQAETPRTLSTMDRDRSGRIVLRPVDRDQYRFTLTHRRGRSSGTFRPCAEPENTPNICQAYDLELVADPVCLGDCSSCVIARLSAMGDDRAAKYIVIRTTPSLTIGS